MIEDNVCISEIDSPIEIFARALSEKEASARQTDHPAELKITNCKAHVFGQLDTPIQPPQQALAARLVRILGIDADQRQAARRDVDV